MTRIFVAEGSNLNGPDEEEKKAALKKLIWKEYEKYCMYLRREDLIRIGEWMEVLIPDGLSRESIFDHLCKIIGFQRFVGALRREADERVAEREKLIAQLGGGCKAFRDDISKLQTFIRAINNLAHQSSGPVEIE